MSVISPMSHADLCDIAVKWLRRPNSQNGHGCCIAASEVKSGWTGEIPDAIGFRQKGYGVGDGSVVVEVKVTRSDFLADRKKGHRKEGGLGNWRYFMCPTNLIKPDELPEGWGLLWVNKRGHVKPMAGPAHVMAATPHYEMRRESLEQYRQGSDVAGEQFILVKLLARVGDPEQVNQKLREAWREHSRLVKRCNSLLEELKEARSLVPIVDRRALPRRRI